VDEKIQDDDLAKADLADNDRRLAERGPYERVWREIDERFPDGAGGFRKVAPGQIRGERNYDTTHITALERFSAAGVAITTPEEKDYIKPRFTDPDLMKVRNVRLWCEDAGRRLYGIRYNARAGFGVAVQEDWGQLGRYGTSIFWTDHKPDLSGMFYRTIHLSECTIDVDLAGLVDTVDRKFRRTARQLEGFFGWDTLTPHMQDALDKDKEQTEFEILHVVAPNRQYDEEKLDWRRFPFVSRYMSVSEKIYLSRKGYHTMPLSAARHMTSPGEKYGRSPGTKMLPAINGLNAMKHTTLRAGHKAVDPAILFNSEDNITRLATRPGGLNPGLVDAQGRVLAARMPGGEQGIPYALELMEAERAQIRTAFLEDFYKILTDPNSRMTTTEVLEVMSKQGILVRPYASRYETEQQDPMSQRELDLAMRYGQIPPFPPEVKEAGAWPQVAYDNMLAAMAKAESTSKTLRFIESLSPIAQIDNGAVFDYLDTDMMVPGLAEEIGVNPYYVRDIKQVQLIRAQRQQDQQQAAATQQLQQAGAAYKDIATANQTREAA
jgi:hypothetical protein